MLYSYDKSVVPSYIGHRFFYSTKFINNLLTICIDANFSFKELKLDEKESKPVDDGQKTTKKELTEKVSKPIEDGQKTVEKELTVKESKLVEDGQKTEEKQLKAEDDEETHELVILDEDAVVTDSYSYNLFSDVG